MKSTATKLVRECEGRRVLWIDLAWEEPEASYPAVQALRQEIRKARGALPNDVAGSAELDRMKSAAEQFCSDYGNYLVSNVSGDAPYERYPQELQRALRTCIDDVKARKTWQPQDTIRLVFHVFQPIKDREARAVKELVRQLTTEYAGVEFAFVHVVDDHDWMMFDQASVS